MPKIFDMSDLENFELPPLPSLRKDEEAAAPAKEEPAPQPAEEQEYYYEEQPADAAEGSEEYYDEANTFIGEDGQRYYYPDAVEETAEEAVEEAVEEAADTAAAAANMAVDPIPESVPASEFADEKAPEKDPVPAKKSPLDILNDPFSLPDLPKPKAPTPEKKSDGDGSDLPPMKAVPEKKEEEIVESVVEQGYSPDIPLEDIDTSGIVMVEMKRASAGRKSEEEELADTAKPIIDDLSDEYKDPEKATEEDFENTDLDEAQKVVLKQKVIADLSRRPNKYSKAVSERLEGRLIEQKNLKIAKKGLVISFFPIVLTMLSAFISYLTITKDWADFDWIKYIGIFTLIGALILFIKAPTTRTVGIIFNGIAATVYVLAGGVLYGFENKEIITTPAALTHFAFVLAATVCSIGAISILHKNEAVKMYYDTVFKKK